MTPFATSTSPLTGITIPVAAPGSLPAGGTGPVLTVPGLRMLLTRFAGKVRKGVGKNCPAIHRWDSAWQTNPSPGWMEEPSCRCCRDFVFLPIRKPATELPGCSPIPT